MENSFYQVSEIEISYRPKFKASERPSIQCSDDAYKIFIHQWNQDKLNYIEEAKMLLLNKRNRVLGIVNLSQGGVSGTIFDPKVIFGIALKANASGIILAHNHPSGEVSPSDRDIQSTNDLEKAGKILGISVFDHLIITEYGWFSFRDEGKM